LSYFEEFANKEEA